MKELFESSYISMMSDMNAELRKEIEDYKSRIEKAVEELELWQPKIESLKLEKKELLDILNGRSDE